jgi:hypothetical protein
VESGTGQDVRRRPIRDAVDYTRQTADFPTRPDSHEPTRSPEISDHDYTQGANEDGRDSTPEEDARLRQESVKDDQAEQIARAIQRDNPYWSFWHDPAKRKQFVEGLRVELNGGRAAEKMRPQQRQDDENELPDDPLSAAGVEKWNRLRKKL